VQITMSTATSSGLSKVAVITLVRQFLLTLIPLVADEISQEL
jgi:hypothetical protein